MNENKCNLPPGFKLTGGMVWEEDAPALGPCCACRVGKSDSVVWINRNSKEEKGWGCITCGVRYGAVAVLCQRCREVGEPVRYICRGEVADGIRAPIEEFTELLDHDLAKHPELLTPLRN